MLCPLCGAAVQPGQKFCTDCGASVSSVTTPPPSAAPVPESAALPPPAPLTPPAPPAPVSAAEPATEAISTDALSSESFAAHADELFAATATLNVVPQTSPTGYEAAAWDDAITGQWQAQSDTGEAPVVQQPFRATPLLAVAVLAGAIAVVTAFIDIATTEVDSGGLIETSSRRLNDFSSTYTVGAIIAAVLMIGGAALGASGRRFGSGLAGGAGLALAGMMGMVVGQAIWFFDATELALLEQGGSFRLTSTQEVGFWLAVVAAALGSVAFGLSLASAGADGYRAISPPVGVLGAFGAIAVAVGPLLPFEGGSFSDNFSNDFIPPATLYLRLLVLILIALGGLVGFLANRRWGLGLALGSVSVAAWQWFASITESGDYPLGIAGGNPGTGDSPFEPHIFTTIGIAVVFLALLAGLLTVAQQRRH